MRWPVSEGGRERERERERESTAKEREQVPGYPPSGQEGWVYELHYHTGDGFSASTTHARLQKTPTPITDTKEGYSQYAGDSFKGSYTCNGIT